MSHIFGFLHGSAHYLIPFVLVLSVVVFVHEFGHYWVARRCGVRVLSFSIGFGQEIFGWNDKHGTRWKVSWLPLGGYVRMYGDADPASALPDENAQAMNDAEKKVAFFYQSVIKRAAIVVAGPATNYLFAIVLLAGLFMTSGQPYTAPVVDTVKDNSAAAAAGIQAGDKVLSIDGQAIDRFEDIKRIIGLNAGTQVTFELVRDGKTMEIPVTPQIVTMTDRLGGEHKLGQVGIGSTKLDYRQEGAFTALGQAVLETWNLTSGTLRAVGQMIIGTRGTEELGGPLRIAEMSGNVAQEGMLAIIWFMAVISVNLGLINLFPVPLLDGGHLAFYAAEGLRGKPLSARAQEVGARIGVVMVASLMVFATWNDLVHLQVISYLIHLFS